MMGTLRFGGVFPLTNLGFNQRKLTPEFTFKDPQKALADFNAELGPVGPLSGGLGLQKFIINSVDIHPTYGADVRELSFMTKYGFVQPHATIYTDVPGYEGEPVMLTGSDLENKKAANKVLYA